MSKVMASWCVTSRSGLGNEPCGWLWTEIIKHTLCEAYEAVSNAESSSDMSASVNDVALTTALHMRSVVLVVVVVASLSLLYLFPSAARMFWTQEWSLWSTRTRPEASRWLHEAGESREFAEGSIPYHLRGGRRAVDGVPSEYM